MLEVAPQRGWTVDHLAEAVRNAILGGRFAPGQRLISRELIAEFHISRGPLREALRRLAADGLIELTPNRGASVRRFSRAEMTEVFQIRELLEGLAARLAAERIGLGDHRTSFSALWERIRPTDLARAVLAFAPDNKAFHRAVVDMSCNRQLAELIDRMQLPIVTFQVRQLLDIAELERSVQEHEAIAEAILAGRPDAADAAMRWHLRRSGLAILALPASAFRPEGADPRPRVD